MKKTTFWSMVLGLALACTVAIPVHAQDRDDDHEHHADQDRDRDRDHDRWERRNEWDYRAYQGDGRPQGWREGERTEWNNCGGGEHRYNCYAYSYQNRPYYYYRDENGNVIVRRQHRDDDRDDWDDHDRH